MLISFSGCKVNTSNRYKQILSPFVDKSHQGARV